LRLYPWILVSPCHTPGPAPRAGVRWSPRQPPRQALRVCQNSDAHARTAVHGTRSTAVSVHLLCPVSSLTPVLSCPRACWIGVAGGAWVHVRGPFGSGRGRCESVMVVYAAVARTALACPGATVYPIVAPPPPRGAHGRASRVFRLAHSLNDGGCVACAAMVFSGVP